jgi:hypothetical protein
MRYQAPYGVSDADAQYVNGDPAIGRQGSIPPAAAFEYPMREIVNAIEESGQTATDADLTQLAKAISKASNRFIIDSGSANALILTPAPAISGYTAGLTYEVKVAANNTGPATVNVSDVGTRNLVHVNGSNLTAGDIVANGFALIAYDGAQFQLISSSANSASETSQVHFGIDTGVANALVASVSPGISSYQAGMLCLIAVANSNTTAATINLNGLGPKSVVRASGGPLSANDLLAGTLAEIGYDGTYFELLNVQAGGGGGGAGGDDITGPLRPYFIAVISATITAPPGSSSVGDTYLIPTGATGAWSGKNGQLAQQTAGGWVYRALPTGHMVGVADSGDYLKKLNSGWRSFFASPSEAAAGTALDLAVTPAGLRGAASINGPLRPPFVAVISGTTTTPPGTPALGDTYMVPASATGAWSGQTNKLTQWDGAAWIFRDYPIESVIGVADTGVFLKRTAGGWRSFWASNAEAIALASTTVGLTPANLAAVLAAYNFAISDYVHSEIFWRGMM